MSDLPRSLVLIGAGKMGGAMLEGWLRLGLAPRGVVVLDPHVGPEMTALCAAHRLPLNPPIAQVAPPQMVVLAIKPQMLDNAAPAMLSLFGPRTALLSIVAGKTVADLSARLPAAAILRAMPNTPAAVGRGITGVFASAGVDAAQRAAADALLQAIGQVAWLEHEGQIDAVTAVSGSGPAYVFYLAECLAAAGEAAGLPPEVAMRLARATVEGAGELMFQAQATAPAQLRLNVTSPGGTTAAALEVLMAPDGLAPLMRAAVGAAKRRAGALSG